MSNTLNINGKKVALKNYTDRIIYSSPINISSMCHDLNLKLPRTLRVNAYKKALESDFKKEYDTLLQQEKENPQSITLTESKRMVRLKYRNSLSETQLEKERININNTYIDEQIIGYFWEALFTFLIQEDINHLYIYGWIQETLKTITVEAVPEISYFNNEIESAIIDPENTLDGLSPEMFRVALFHTANKQEIQTIGKKYGIDLPRSLNKKEVQKIFLEQLTKNNKLTPAIKERVINSTIKELKAFAEELEEELQTYLTKESLIEYILENASSTKENYYVATSQEAYAEHHFNTKKDAEETHSSNQELLEIREELRQIKALIQTLNGNNEVVHKQEDTEDINLKTVNPPKRLPRLNVLDVFAGILIIYLFLGLMTYFLRDFSVFAAINNTFNRVTYRDYGLMEIYHLMLDFIIAR